MDACAQAVRDSAAGSGELTWFVNKAPFRARIVALVQGEMREIVDAYGIPERRTSRTTELL